VFRIKFDHNGSEDFLIQQGRNFWRVPTLGALAEAFPDRLHTLEPVKAKLYGCWDVNPASFHSVLLEQLGNRKMGFVMDRTRTGQVWNQPVFKARFAMGPLRSVDEIDDAAAEYRASGTAFVTEVMAEVSWLSEPAQPRISYDQGRFDLRHVERSVYRYTLEFDAAQRLIGGEWGTLQAMDPAASAPDFIYGFEKGATPKDATVPAPGKTRLDYSGIIGKLHGCSLEPSSDGQARMGSVTLSYKNCVIEKTSP
jgi:hypothetical protein